VLALIPNPKIVFLDELTTGLDPQARRTIWECIKDLQREGMTIFMTTHYMEEAEYLCGRLCFINKGKVAAMDTVEKILGASGIDHVVSFDAVRIELHKVSNIIGVNKVEQEGSKVILQGKGKKLLADIVNFLERENVEYSELNFKKPNLEDVFLKLTGAKIGA
jgi:ABC-2 type transport system ATP-binding protein